MPFTVKLHPNVIPVNITQRRLDSYKSVFDIASEFELVGAYLWNLHVCSSLYPLVNFAEITVRNSIDQALTAATGRFWWDGSKLRYKSHGTGCEPEVIEKIVDNFSRAYSSVRREKRERYKASNDPTHDEIVAKTDFSTWEYMFNHEFLGRDLIWPQLLGDVLKGTWPTTKAGTTLDAVRNNIKAVSQFRNRLSHHEPIWKKFRVLNEKDAVIHLNEKIDSIEKLIGLFSPDALNLLHRNNFLSNARMACSLQEISRFKYRATVHNVKSFSKIKKVASMDSLQEGSIHIRLYVDRKRKYLMVPMKF